MYEDHQDAIMSERFEEGENDSMMDQRYNEGPDYVEIRRLL